MLIPHRLFGVTEQLPASGAHTRVDTGKGAGQSHRTGGNAQTWHFAARHIEDFVATGQVRRNLVRSQRMRPTMRGRSAAQ